MVKLRGFVMSRFLFTVLALSLFAVVACVDDPLMDEAELPEGVESIESAMGNGSLEPCGGACPGAWLDLSCVSILCAQGYQVESRVFGDTTCGRCSHVRGGPNSCGSCQVTGCSGQICSSDAVITTCEWRPEYACYQELGECGCNGAGAGSCGWAQTPELRDCLAQFGQ